MDFYANENENENDDIIVNVVDCIMGKGKTSSAINYINSLGDDVKIMYITPYLDEVKRIKESCYNKKFYEPQEYGTKKNGLKHDLEKGRNIVTTHALFQFFDDEIIDLCYSQNYILFLDEVADVVDKFSIDPIDVRTLTEKYTTVEEETGKLIWNDEWDDYSSIGVFYKAKKLCEAECLYVYNNTIMIWMFPVKVFKAFRESYILTYLFEAQMQKYYYDFYNIKYNYIYVDGDSKDNYHFVKNKIDYATEYDYKSLIHIIDDIKMNRIGDKYYDLSASWFKRNRGNSLNKLLKKNTYNFFKHYRKSKSSDNIWTVFSAFKDDVKGDGYTKGFVPCNMRATNEYKDRTNIAYLINRFYDPNVYNFFLNHDIKVDEEKFALSEMLQFIWRSAIRQGEEIWLYVPSKRMREILIEWIDKMHEEYLYTVGGNNE